MRSCLAVSVSAFECVDVAYTGLDNFTPAFLTVARVLIAFNFAEHKLS